MSANGLSANSTYTNPILPGWHSDPSCIFVPEEDNTFFCAVSSFLTFPGIPIYASRDLIHWKLASNVVSRPTQVPEIASSTSQTQQDGLWASTLRYRKGKFYLLSSYVSMYPGFKFKGLLFTSTKIFSDEAWSDPIWFNVGDIDPDLFWGDLPEGPHIYRKDGYYYLSIAERGTELGHRQSIARARNITGPYEGYRGNPILTNANTTEYFQTVGHADLFQDASGNWWGSALATRSGPAWKVYPMGRETVLFPVAWKEGEWPVLEPVRGEMSGWALPHPHNKEIPGDGAYVDAADSIDFPPRSTIPRHFVFWRLPKVGSFTVSPPERPFSLRLLPSRHNLTGSTGVAGETVEETGITLITRRQSHTYFTYSVDVSFAPTEEGEEVGVTVFLTQYQHIDLGVVFLPSPSGKLTPHIRFRTTLLDDLNQSKPQNVTDPETITTVLPCFSKEIKAKLQIKAANDTHYVFSASLPGFPDFSFSPLAEAALVSGGTGRFTGALLGAYATSNGGSGSSPAYISQWRYESQGQRIE
ncbi:hypothetical protein P175DRAFT_0529819 [Aspergillus ochraceoroseus IBT 24754]|uniref:Beta-xylosidase C-terminal Concanavalin A-like domain-containing protein n=1 Tax=Aspergillus ochraceoroseus IBT 24754 TaxID=1392256 RepID=A0A2T5M2J5_9EURO|nr:uncharacterized protein P175DRAFT_0529819 [Aspergillus ochraceoroseus IBT 24754]PTU22741.1 hypothetical protein P175DRAFT_0529819 [Aspergillus ochraceoroseus IBT 24754]